MTDKEIANEGKYKTISLPRVMLDKIQEIVETHGELGFPSISAFVASAIRNYPEYQKFLEEEG